MLNPKVVRSLILTASVCAWAGVTIPDAHAVELQAVSPTHSGADSSGVSPSVGNVSADVQIDAPATSAISPDSELADSEPSMLQVTSVSQLSDVRPTDWAFQALQSLVERYGCIAGYPDRTYRGNRALTRYEFAAGLNACLDRVNELIAASTAELVKKEDLITVQRLQEQFAAELATLRGRVDAIATRTATLEKQQFSTTTKLNTQIWVNITGAFTKDDVIAERSLAQGGNSPFIPPTRVGGVPTRVQRRQPNITLSNYLALTLNTSFTGKDSLVTQLVAGNAVSPANQLVSAGFFNSWGVPFTDQTGTPQSGSNAVYLRELSYTFPVTENIRVAVGPRLNAYRYFDQNRFTVFLTGAGSYNSSGSTLFAAVDRGSGATVAWTINPQLKLTAGYLAENTEFVSSAAGFNTSSNPAAGLFDSTNQIIGELAFSPSKKFNLRLLYSRSLIRPYNGFIGGTVGEPLPYGYADDGFGGRLDNAIADTFIANFDWLLTSRFGIFGRYSYGRTEIDPVNPARSGGNVRVQSIQFGLGFPDLGKKGALGVVSYLIPHSYLSGREFLLSGAGDGGKQQELEVSYYYPITNNIAIVPAFYAIFNPNNFESNSTVFVGNLRTQFSF